MNEIYERKSKELLLEMMHKKIIRLRDKLEVMCEREFSEVTSRENNIYMTGKAVGEMVALINLGFEIQNLEE